MKLSILLTIVCLFAGLETTRAQSACPSLGPNLITNGNFELGYYGFTSDFGRGRNNATLGNCSTQGWILVTETDPHYSPTCQIYPFALSGQYGSPNTPTSPDPNDPSNTSVVTVDICGVPLPDHTPGGRFFLTIDPDGIPGRAYWKQTIQVCANTNYVFSVWVRNVSPGCGLPAPFFHFEVGGVPINTPVSYPDCDWVNTSATWNSGNLSGDVLIELVNDLPGCDANDVAIDDLFFGVCGGAFLTCPTEFSFCGDSWDAPVTLSGNSYGFTAPQFQWQHFDPVTSNWVDIPGASDSVFVLPFITATETGPYRLTAAADGVSFSPDCYAVTDAIEISLNPVYPNHLIQADICAGEIYSGHSAAGVYVDTLLSAAGCDSIRTLELRVFENIETSETVTTCPGEAYFFNGAWLTESGNYEAVFSTVHGCDSLVTLELTVPPARFLGNDTVVCSADSYRLRSPFAQTVWFDGSTGHEVIVSQTGYFSAQFVDSAGCLLRDTIFVQFGVEVFVPNAFSPNDDGVNDVFLPDFSEMNFLSYDFQVFDRWGSRVFQTSHPGTGWAGKCRAKACDAGVYVYLIRIITAFCGEMRLSGDVSLIKN